MKKTLTMILTLALVICMMPASAFAAAVGSSVTIGGVTYAITFGPDSFDYNAKTQVPTVTLTKQGESSPDSTLTYSYKQNNTPVAEPKEAGVYEVWVKDASNHEAKVGEFTIKTVDIGSAVITTQPNVNINATIKETIEKLQTQSMDTTLKKYFKVTYGGTEVLNSNYTLSSTVSGNTISIKAKNTDAGSFSDSVKTTDFKVVSSLTDFTVAKADNSTDFMYTGGTQNPTLKVSNGITTLTKGTDYTVTCTSAGTAVGSKVTVTVTGIGSYTGTITQDFEIEKFDLSKATVTPETIYVQQNSTAIDITVKAGNNTLVKDRDFTVANLNTSTIGTVAATNGLTITGKGPNYTGTKKVGYTVIAANSKNFDAASLTKVTNTYNGNVQTPTPTLTIGSTPVSTSYYTVKYRAHSTTGSYSAKPVNVGVYDVLVELTAAGKNAGYTPTSKEFASAFEITPLAINSSSITATYNGTVAKPVILKLNGKELSRYIDYDVDDYSSSKYVYTVTGKGNFTGTKLVYTETRDLSSCTVTFDDNRSTKTYGPAYYPGVTVYYGSTKLNKESDYTVTYKNANNQTVSYCKDAGTYSVIVTGIGSYKGTKTLYFTITGTDIGNYTVTLKESKVSADGRSKTPVITSVAYGYASKLNTTDYTVSYQDSTGKEVKSYQMSAPGTYRVVVTGKNGYTGSCYANFTIEGLAQSITGVESSYKIYPTSDAFKLQAKATEGVITYTSSDPSVASVDAYGYVTPHKAGRAKITISTTGNVKYNPANDSTVIKVYPNKAKLTRKPWKTGKGKIKVRWNKQDNVTRYEVRYARNKSFKKGTYKTKKRNAAVNSYTTQSTTISGLYSGYTYYVKVRAVKEVYNDYGKKLTYYGRWSGWRSVRVK